MSTNKTEYHQLHAWVPEDDFLLSEINENFAAIDAVLPRSKGLRVAAGSYLGNDKSGHLITLGFRPKAVALSCKMNESHPINTICIDGVENYGCAIADEGFTVSSYLNEPPSSNAGYVPGSMVNPYTYIAFDWEE